MNLDSPIQDEKLLDVEHEPKVNAK